jgi:hypothetical protein
MIDQVIESRRPFPWGAVLFFVLAAPFLAVALAERNYHWAVGGCLPFLIGLVLWLKRPYSLTFQFTESGLRVLDRDELVPYETFETVIASNRPGDPDKPGPRSYPIQLVHEQGTLHIPARLNVPSDEVFQYLLMAFPPSGSSRVNPLLRDYLDEQTEAFGADRVLSYRARTHLGTRPPNRAVAVCLAVLVTGLIWMGVAAITNNGPWMGGALAAILCGGVLALTLRLLPSGRKTSRVKHWKQASLVISPVGLALVQGDLKGEMRWDELRDLKFNRRTAGFQLDHSNLGRGILLQFEGARVLIADIYDRPLNLIYQQIRKFWRGP